MLDKNMTKREIEKNLEGKGDYIQLDYLNRFLKESSSIDMKKFIFLKLAEVYEKIGMLSESAKNYGKAGTLSLTFSEKMKYYVKEAERYIMSNDFQKTEAAMKKAMNEANSIEKEEIYLTIKDFYKTQAEKFLEGNKLFHAVKIYEKLLEMNASEKEKEGFKEKISNINERLGGKKVRLGFSN
ncbi:hypothetical protein K0A97_02135 [Patescibacteria group bacterium]|nr:hypothetical protein [Patescibacteria group bacterium]